MGSSQSYTVLPGPAVLVSVPDDESAIVTNNGPAAVYYGNSPSVTVDTALGSIVPRASGQLFGPWFVVDPAGVADARSATLHVVSVPVEGGSFRGPFEPGAFYHAGDNVIGGDRLVYYASADFRAGEAMDADKWIRVPSAANGIPLEQKGAPGGVATLDPITGKLTASQFGAAAHSELKRAMWLPTGAIDQTVAYSRDGSQAQALVSGQLLLAGGVVIPAGQEVSAITFLAGSQGAVTPTNQWFCIVDQDLTVLAKTADATNAAWAANTAKTLNLTAPYIPTVNKAVYLGIVVGAGTPPNLRGANLSSQSAGLIPIMAATSTGSLTNPVSLGATAGALTAVAVLPYAFVELLSALSASFTATQDTATRMILDAGTSEGVALTYAWEVDGVPHGVGPVVPMVKSLGEHNVVLTITDHKGRTDTDEQIVEVIWRGWPYSSQWDATNAIANIQPDTEKWVAPVLDPVGPWVKVAIVNRNDNVPTFTMNPDGSARYQLNVGDRASPSGGYRALVGLTSSPYTNYNWQAAGAQGPIDIDGKVDNEVRFLRHELRLPSENTLPLTSVNSLFEIQAPNVPMFQITLNGAGTQYNVKFQTKTLGVVGPAVHLVPGYNIVADQWQNFVLEYKLSTDPAIGYVRLFKDGVCVTIGHAQADGAGRIFKQTWPTESSGAKSTLEIHAKFYCGTDFTLPRFLDLRRTAIGKTLAAVMA